MMFRKIFSCIIFAVVCCGYSGESIAEFGNFEQAQNFGWTHTPAGNLGFWEYYPDWNLNHTGIDYDIGDNATHANVLSNGFGFVTHSRADGCKADGRGPANYISVRHELSALRADF